MSLLGGVRYQHSKHPPRGGESCQPLSDAPSPPHLHCQSHLGASCHQSPHPLGNDISTSPSCGPHPACHTAATPTKPPLQKQPFISQTWLSPLWLPSCPVEILYFLSKIQAALAFLSSHGIVWKSPSHPLSPCQHLRRCSLLGKSTRKDWGYQRAGLGRTLILLVPPQASVLTVLCLPSRISSPTPSSSSTRE